MQSFAEILKSLSTGVSPDKGGHIRIPYLTDQQVLNLAARHKGYRLGLRKREEEARAQASRLQCLGLLEYSREAKLSDGVVFHISDTGREALRAMRKK